MPLSSASTLTEIQAAYLDNAAYAENGSASQAATFISACRMLLLKIPKRVRHGGGSEIEIDPAILRAEMQAAQTWHASNATTTGSGGGGVLHADFSGFRD